MNANTKTVSELLHRLVDGFSDERMSLRHMVSNLEQSGFCVLLILFSAPLMLPLSPPGFTLVMALPMMFLSLQMIAGLRAPWMPETVGKRSVKTEAMKSVVTRLDPYFKFMDRFLKPRLLFMSGRFGERMIGVWCLLCALAIPIPLPVINSIASGAIFLMALGLLQRDGLVIKAGILVAIGTMLIVIAIAFLGAEAVTYALEAFKSSIF